MRRGVVAIIVRDARLLVIRRSLHVVAPRALCFPGGAIEPGETEPIALVRELEEELGVPVEPVRHVWRSVTPWDVEISWWQASLAAEHQIDANPNEVESVHWFLPSDLIRQPDLLESNRSLLYAVHCGEIQIDGVDVRGMSQ